MNAELTNWRKSSFSGGNGGQCVEVAWNAEVAGVRDTSEAHLAESRPTIIASRRAVAALVETFNQ